MKIAVDAYLDNNLGDDLMIKYFATYFKIHEIYLSDSRESIKNSFKDIPNIYFYNPKKKEKKISFDCHVTIGGQCFYWIILKVGLDLGEELIIQES